MKPTLPTHPMRLSIEAGDPGFEAYEAIRIAGKDVRVTLDGDKVLCITADEAEGFVVVYDDEYRGYPAVSNLPTKVLRGTVVVEIYDRQENAA